MSDELTAKIDKAAATIAKSINVAVGAPEDRSTILLEPIDFVSILEALRRAIIPLVANLTEDEFDAFLEALDSDRGLWIARMSPGGDA